MGIRVLSVFIAFSLAVVWAGTTIWTLNQSATSEVFNGIAAPNGNFAIGVGEGGAIVHFVNNDNGTVIESGTTNELFDVYASSEILALAVGEEIALMWDGNTWETIETGFAGSIYTGTWISPQEDVFWYGILGSPFSTVCPFIPGSTEPQPFCRAFMSPMITACGESGDGKLLLASGDIINFNNLLGEANGTVEPIHDEIGSLSLTGIFVPEDSCLPGPIEPLELFAIRNGNQFWRFDGSDWANMNVAVPGGQTLTWLDGTSSNRIVAVGFESNGMGGNQGVVWIYDNETWTQDTDLPAGTPGLTDIVAKVEFANEIFSSGFEDSSNQPLGRANKGSLVAIDAGIGTDILAAAEQGNTLYTPDLFTSMLADVTVEKTRLTTGPFRNGDTITYQIVVQNLGPNTATDFRFLDGFNFSMDYVSDTCGFSQFNQQAGWGYYDTRVAELKVNEVLVCTITLTINGMVGDEIRNYAAVAETNEHNWDNNRSDSRGVFISPP